ncbi:MAG: hypothetical protein WBD99_14655 [Thermodesulfobacteriota bacterium]
MDTLCLEVLVLIIFSELFQLLFIFSCYQPGTILSSAGFGALIGFFHGCVVSFTLTVVVDEDHPIRQFRTYGYEVVLYHWVAQILYGIVLGAGVGTVHPKLF